ncbi:MAG: hypothetical protein K2Q06_01265 [Parvularculaceae bacterium]|nr:hypothetical protein [Parvularculaceae bacterium]
MIDLRSTTATAVCAAMLWGCQTTGVVNTPGALQKYIDQNGYTPFSLPRDKWGGGTVVKFSGGRENIVYFNDQCLGLTGPGDATDIRSADVSLPQSSYTISRTAKVEASLAKDFAANVDITAAYNDSRVSKVNVTLTGPKELVASQGSIAARIRALIAAKNPCVDEIFKDGSFVIDRVVAVDGFAYTLETTQGQSLNFDAAILKAINVGPELSAKLVGNSAMSSSTPRMLGYRVFKYTAEGGLGETKIKGTRVSPAEVAAMLAK